MRTRMFSISKNTVSEQTEKKRLREHTGNDIVLNGLQSIVDDKAVADAVNNPSEHNTPNDHPV